MCRYYCMLRVRSIFFAIFIGVGAASAQEFSETEITTAGDYYGLSSVLHGDEIYLAHYGLNGDLLYTSPDSGSYSTDTVDANQAASPPDPSSETSLVFDDAGFPHIFYHNAAAGDLRHAYISGAAWTSETIDSGGSVGEYADAIRCNTNKLCVCFKDSTSQNLKFAIGTAGSWTIEVADSSADDVGSYCDLVELVDGSMRAAHFDATNRQLRVSTRSAGGAWSSETVPYAQEYGMWPSIAVSGDGVIQVYASAYKASDIGASDAGLYLAAKAGAGGWTVNSAENNTAGGYPSLLFNSEGRYRLAYRHLYTGGLFPQSGFIRLIVEQPDASVTLATAGTAPFCYPRYRHIAIHENSSGLLTIAAARDQNGSCNYGIVVFAQHTPAPTPTATATPEPTATSTPAPSPTATPEVTNTPELPVTCTLTIKAIAGSSRRKFTVSLRRVEQPLGNIEFSIQSRKRKGAFKTVAQGTTKANGKATKKLVRRAAMKYRAVFSNPNCTTRTK